MCTAEPSYDYLGRTFCTLIFRTWRARQRESYRLLPLLLEFSSESARLRAAGRRLLQAGGAGKCRAPRTLYSTQGPVSLRSI